MLKLIHTNREPEGEYKGDVLLRVYPNQANAKDNMIYFEILKRPYVYCTSIGRFSCKHPQGVKSAALQLLSELYSILNQQNITIEFANEWPRAKEEANYYQWFESLFSKLIAGVFDLEIELTKEILQIE